MQSLCNLDDSRYKGDVYVFDFDDTLAWCPSWYNEPIIDEGYVSDPMNSISLRNAFNLLDKHGFKLQVETSTYFHKEIYFLVTFEGRPVRIDELIESFSPQELEHACVKEFLGYASISTDFEYYKSPSTVGFIGFNQEILDIYLSNHNSSVILTARQSLPGIRERILEFVITEAPPPIEIITQPLDSKDSGSYKGAVLTDIAKLSGVNHVYFYDDNIGYIRGARRIIEKSGLESKVTLIHVNTNNKPHDFRGI